MFATAVQGGEREKRKRGGGGRARPWQPQLIDKREPSFPESRGRGSQSLINMTKFGLNNARAFGAQAWNAGNGKAKGT